MKVKSKNVRNFTVTFILISCLFVVAYFLCNNDTMMRVLPVKFNNKVAQGKILNKRYNSKLEGSILDSLYDYNASLISLKETKILHKEPLIGNNITLINPKNSLSLENLKVQTFKNSNQYYNYYVSRPKSKYNSILASRNNHNDLSIEMPEAIRPSISSTKKSGNRFQGLINKYNSDEVSQKVLAADNTALLSSIKNWDSSKGKRFYKLGHNLPYKTIKPETNKKSLLNYKITSSRPVNSKIKIDVVQDFSSDPLNTVIHNVLIPGGLPKTAANVDAVARAMGLPSGALGSSHALAGSLGLTVEELSNPKTKLSSQVVTAINKNKEYIGSKLDVNNTTLSEYYYQALKSKLSENKTEQK